MHTTLEKNRENIEQTFLFPLRENEKLSERLHEESNRARADGEYQRDYTRILYSSSFRRLQGKMQLFAVQSDQFIRNRLTHSLEVAQIARSIALEIGYTPFEIYIVEACALAHDIGNPPFGHAGEKFLNELSREIGGFEGNAQTLRILTTVEQKRADFQGLNLTYRTLLGILKYFNQYNKDLGDDAFSAQKFIYKKDYELITQIVHNTGVELRTLDVQIVDLADEIAYAAHDLDDGLRIGVFHVDEIMHDFCRIDTDEVSRKMLKEIFEESRERAGFQNRNISSADFSKLYRKEVTSRIIHTLINDIGIVPLTEEGKARRGTKRTAEIGFVHYGKLASGLKATTYECITNNDRVYAYENTGKQMLQKLNHFYNENPSYLPPEYRAENVVRQYKEAYQEESRDKGLLQKLQKRLVMDYITGMMDAYVKTSYDRLIRQ